MSPNDVQIIQIGRPEWPTMDDRSSSHAAVIGSKGVGGRSGGMASLWAHQATAEEELPLAKLFWQIQGVDDE